MTDPLFSILTPVFNPPIPVLQEAIRSVCEQSISDWEWVVVDDCSPNPRVREVLRRAASKDARIRLIERTENGHIVRATNDALAAAKGEFIALLDHDDWLAPDALEQVRKVLDDHVDYVYSDEDFVAEDGSFVASFQKPDWSPERLRGQMYAGHLSAIRRSLVLELGGYREGFDGSQDYDLVLRVTECARRIVHIPRILYHWRQLPGSVAASGSAKPYAHDAAFRALTEHLERCGINGKIVQIPDYPGHYRVVRELDPSIKVSVIIPTAFQEGLVWGQRRTFVVEAIRSLLSHNSHPNLEIVVVHDKPADSNIWAELENLCGERLIGVSYLKPFNFSERINAGAVASTGDRLILLNDDVESASNGWLEQLVAPLDDPAVGMTGSLLLFSDGTIQHAGHGYEQDVHYHPYRDVMGDEPGRMGDLLISHEVSGVTAAVAAIRRDTFYEVGGMCEELPNNFNDVDLSKKVEHLGLRNVYIAASKLYHFESKSRDPRVTTHETRFIRDRWGKHGTDRYLPDLLPDE